jgi:hypothetical protein
MNKPIGGFLPQNIEYYANSDLIAQIVYELINHPQSCFAVNTASWYNSLYSASPEDSSCLYQVRINQDLCPPIFALDKNELITYLSNLTFTPVDDALLDYLVSLTQGLSETNGRKLVNGYRASLLDKFNSLI